MHAFLLQSCANFQHLHASCPESGVVVVVESMVSYLVESSIVISIVIVYAQS